MGYIMIGIKLLNYILHSFNSLYGIQHLQSRVKLKLVFYFQFPLWDTGMDLEQLQLKYLLLSIPFMGYIEIEERWNPEEDLYFQFPLWDTPEIKKYDKSKAKDFQFPLWDTILLYYAFFDLHNQLFQFPLWDTYGLVGTCIGSTIKLSIPFMGYGFLRIFIPFNLN